MPKAKSGKAGGTGGGVISSTVRAASGSFKPAPKRTVNHLPGSGSGSSGSGAGGRQARPSANTSGAASGAKMPYSKNRPKYGKGQVERVWADAKDAQGRVWVKNMAGQQEEVRWQPGQPRRGVWDMGHKPQHEYRDLHSDYMAGKISRDDFLRGYRDPANYFVEHPLRNQSHVDEQGR